MKSTQDKILAFIKQYHAKHSLTPSIREICKGTGLKSTSSVSYHLVKLVENGTLVNDKHKSRAYRLTQDNTLSFKAKWDRLKKWIDEDITNGEYYFKIINKMKELENGE